VVQNFGRSGITFAPTATSDLAVSDTLLLNNDQNGVFITTGVSAVITAAFNHVQANNNTSAGFFFSEQSSSGGSITATISESAAANNNVGVDVSSSFSSPAVKATLSHSVVTNNSTGLLASSVAATVTLTVAQSTVTGNAAGWNINSNGAIRSYQDNYFNDNGPNTGSMTSVTKQ
jgi:hypothetical protein